jgi:hypothetical protein
MATAKRLYFYGVSGLSLGLLIYAGTILSGLLLDQLGLASTTSSVLESNGVQWSRESLSVAIGLVVVGLPVWLFHWAAVERMVAGSGPSATAERHSIVRSVYFGLILLWLAIQVAASGTDLLREAIARPFGATDPYGFDIGLSGPLSWVLIGGGAFAYHGVIRARDMRREPAIKGAAAWWSRLCFYGFAAGAFAATLFAVGSIITTLGQVASGYAGLDPSSQLYQYVILPQGEAPTAAWWVRPVVAAYATALVYCAAWVTHWWYSDRLACRNDEQGHLERNSRVRLAYFVVVVGTCAAFALAELGQGLGVGLRYVVGAWHVTLGQALWGEVLVPFVAALPALGGWLWHRREAVRDSVPVFGSPLRAIRPLDYSTSLIGLAVFASAIVAFLNFTLQSSGTTVVIDSSDSWQASATGAIAFAVVAIPIWLLPWLAGQRRLGVERVGEAGSTARRAFLFAVSGLTVASSAISAAVVVSRLTRMAVGLDSTGLASDVRVPLCVLAVSLPILAIHAYWLRRDLAVTRALVQIDRTATEDEAEPIAVSPIAGPADAGQELVILGPAGVDYEALRSWLVSTLPDGYTVGVRSAQGADPA